MASGSRSYCLVTFRRGTRESRGGIDFGTEYDYADACPACGTGARQIGPLRMSVRVFPECRAFITGDEEPIVADELAFALKAADPSIELGNIVDKTGSPLPFRQIRPSTVLPPFLESTEGVTKERQCRECKRDGYFSAEPHVPIVLNYPRKLIATLPCAAVTYERFGNSSLGREPGTKRRQAGPLLVLRTDLFVVLEQSVGRDVDAQPIVFR